TPTDAARLKAGWMWVKDWYEWCMEDELYLEGTCHKARIELPANSIVDLDFLQALIGPWLRRWLKDLQEIEGKQNFLMNKNDKRSHFRNWLCKMDTTKNPSIEIDLRKSKNHDYDKRSENKSRGG